MIYRPVPKERAIKIGGKPVAIVFAHGAYQSEEDLRPLRDILESEGVPTLAPRLPIEFPFKPQVQPNRGSKYLDSNGRPLAVMGLDDLAAKLLYDIQSHEIKRAIMVGLSLGGDVIARAAAMGKDVDIVHMDYFACPMHKATVASLYPRRARSLWRRNEDVPLMIKRNTSDYLEAIDDSAHRALNHEFGITIKPFGLTGFDKSKAGEVFFNRSSPQVADQSSQRLRPQWRNKTEARLDHWRKVPSDSFWGEHDNVTTEGWCHERSVLKGARFTKLDCDHSAHLSIKEEMAEILLEQVRIYH